MDKRDLLSKLAQVYDEKYQEEKPILFPSDIPRQDVEAIAREIVSTIESYDVNIDKRELEKLSKEIAEGYLFELEVDKLINKTFEEIKKKENLDENVTLDKFIEEPENIKIFGKYLDATNKNLTKNLEKKKKIVDFEKAGGYIIYQAMETVKMMNKYIKHINNHSKIEEDAIDYLKGQKTLENFIILLTEMKIENTPSDDIKSQEDFTKFALSTLEKIESEIEIEEEINKVRQYIDALKYKILMTFKNTEKLSQRTKKELQKLKQDLTNVAEIKNINKTIEDTIKQAIKIKATTKLDIERLKQIITEKQELLRKINKQSEEEYKGQKFEEHVEEEYLLEEVKSIMGKRFNEIDTIYNPAKIIDLYKTELKEKRLENLNKYIGYYWIYKTKELNIARDKIIKVIYNLTMEIERRREEK